MRVKRGFKARRRRNRVLKLAKGFRGRRHGTYKRAVEAVERAMMQSARSRRGRPREFRSLWIARVKAGAPVSRTPYSRLVGRLEKYRIRLQRQGLAGSAGCRPPSSV